MAKLDIGFCGICGNQIWHLEKPRRPNDQYAEISLMLSDQTIARHAICKSCIVDLSDGKINDLFQRIQDTWFDDMVGWATESQMQQMRALVVVAWDPFEDRCLEKFKQLKEKQNGTQ